MNLKQTKADFKRIIETNLNINAPKPPALLKYSDIYTAISDGDFVNRLKLYNPTPNDYAQTHHVLFETRKNNVRLFLSEQLRIDNEMKLRRLRKNNYSRSDFYKHDGTTQYTKKNGTTLARTIHDVRNPPDIEQERKNLDYTLRACEYIRRIEQIAKVRDKLEPRLKQIDQEFEKGEWTYMAWNALGVTHEQGANLSYLFNLHRTHVSLMNPLQIAHYPTLKHLRDGREVVTKLGKYLTTFKDFIGLSEAEIKDIVEKYNAIVASRTGWEVRFIESTDADGFVRIYRDALAGSCMKGMDAVRVYAHEKSVIRLAYIQSVAGEILARCIVREDLKQYVRIYPDANGSTEGKYLQQYLKANGYTHGNLDGCLLKMIEHEDEDDIFVAPYIDAGVDGNGSAGSAQSGDIVEIDGKEYIEINSNGDLCLTMTNGYTDDVENDEDYSNCDHCEDRVHNDDTYWTWHDEYICSHCEQNHYTSAYVERNREELVHNDRVIWVGDVAYHEDVEFSDFDIYYCEASDQWCHADDLVYTSMGDIHYDYAQRLDHADDEGNNYAHHDDAHQLSDGSWCHRKNAEELQEELDDADKEDDEEETTQNESGYYFGKNLTPEQKQHNHNLLDQAEKDILKNENI